MQLLLCHWCIVGLREVAIGSEVQNCFTYYQVLAW